MINARALWLWLSVAIVASLAFALWGVGRWSDAADDAAAAAGDVVDAEQWRADILAARVGTPTALSGVDDVTRVLSEALATAKIDPVRLASVGNAEVRPVAGSRLVERRTPVSLRGVTMAQALTLTRAIESADGGLGVSDLHLSTAPKSDAGLWDLDLTLSAMTPDASRAGQRT